MEESTAPRILTPYGSFDGYDWHRHDLRARGKMYRTYEANGNGGQFLLVVADLDLVVCDHGGNYNQYRIWRKFREELVPQYVMAAILER